MLNEIKKRFSNNLSSAQWCFILYIFGLVLFFIFAGGIHLIIQLLVSNN